VAFYVVYILEAHPIDAWQDEDNAKDKIALASEKTLDERCAVADTCLTKLSIKLPAVIDNLDNSTETAYTAWPDRLYVIDRDGRVAYKSKPGPYGFKPREVEQTLRRLIPASPSQQITALQ
jgi:iodothyronine deiodinase-like protein